MKKMSKIRKEKDYKFTWWMHLSNKFHSWVSNWERTKKKGYCYTRYPTPEEAWVTRNQTDPDPDVKKLVESRCKKVVHYNSRKNDFLTIQANGSWRSNKRNPGDIRRPFIGYCCEGCDTAGEFHLFETRVEKDGQVILQARCYPCAYETLV